MKQKLEQLEQEKKDIGAPFTPPTSAQIHLSGSLQQWQVPSSAVIEVGILSRDGSFGDVYLVQYRGVYMAFKTIRTGGSKESQTQAKAALKEACALKEAQHDNVVRLEGICIDDPHRLGVLMEYAEQGTLRLVLDNSPGMSKMTRRLLIRGIFRGLAKLHSHTPKPILHGDLKSTNVLVMADGTAKLADFGMASGTSSGVMASLNMSMTHRGGGTPIYSAPELFTHLFDDSDSDDEDASTVSMYTAACDVYSAAVLIWEVVTGEVPWQNNVQKWSQNKPSSYVERKLAKEVLKKNNRPALPSDCNPLLLSIIERCWQ
jgi:serine/threonine protein kinase